MNHLVFLDTQAGELEKILSGVKTMILREVDPAQYPEWAVSPGDSLYFLRDENDSCLRVKATVVRVMRLTNRIDKDLSHTLKELQPKLQLTEEQYNHWAVKRQALAVEFDAAHKIPVIDIAVEGITDRSTWIPFEEFNRITS